MSTLVTIATYHSQPQAEAVRLHLAHAGIEAVLVNESIVAMDWLLMNAVGGIKLQVASSDAQQAARIIHIFEAEEKERRLGAASQLIRFKCSECGAIQQFKGDRRGGVETCKKCGRFIDVPEVSEEQWIDEQASADTKPESLGDSKADLNALEVKRNISLPVEVVCVLAFAVLPPLINAMLPADSSLEEAVSFAGQMASVTNMFSVVAPLLFIIAVSGEPWSKFGVTRPKWGTDIVIAIGVWFVATFFQALTLILLTPFRAEVTAEQEAVDVALAMYPESPITWSMLLMLFIGLTANSITEELAMRGYLIPRFEELFKSPVVAVGLSAALFASYHLYQGILSVIAIFMVGVVFGVFFFFTRRLWPLILAHTAMNMLIYLRV